MNSALPSDLAPGYRRVTASQGIASLVRSKCEYCGTVLLTIILHLDNAEWLHRNTCKVKTKAALIERRRATLAVTNDRRKVKG